ncbi:MAG: M48 family metalloprotease [Granulosicoccus sp.]
MGALIHVVIAAVSVALGQGGSFAHPSKPAVVMIALVWLTMIAGSLFRLMDVRAGGAVLARRFGAVHASDRSRHENERQLLNVVAEVSIAATTPQPDVFVLRHENSINAFVLGNSRSRPVIVLTEGALDAFDREQLQAVVAHELAHITNGDLIVNMRLLVTMGGLMAIDEVGRLLIGKADRETIHPGVFVGWLLCILGNVGVVSGKLISAAFSRQREYLADASAVQFTRNPYALAAALDVVREHGEEPALHGVHARELAHLCFQSGKAVRWMKKQRWLRRLFASHPDMDLRIKAIEPHFEVKKRKASRRDTASESNMTSLGSTPYISDVNQMQMVNIDAESGHASNIVEMSPVAELSDRILLLLPTESMCLAALFALFVHEGGNQRHDFLSALGFSFNDEFTNDVRKVMKLVPDELARDQLGIISHVSTVLNKRLSVEQRQKVALKLERLLSVNGEYQLMDYARVQLIRRKLLIEFPVISAIASEGCPQAKARKAKTFDSMGREFALLLSLMVESSGATPAEMDEQFRRVLKCYTQESFPRRTANETGIIDELEAAFQTLYVQPHPIRHAFVQHCIEIMRHDGLIMPNERALLDLFAASLGCEELIAA